MYFYQMFSLVVLRVVVSGKERDREECIFINVLKKRSNNYDIVMYNTYLGNCGLSEMMSFIILIGSSSSRCYHL